MRITGLPGSHQNWNGSSRVFLKLIDLLDYSKKEGAWEFEVS